MTSPIVDQPTFTGRVLQVSVSSGGVPKLPVERAFVGRFGLEGDRHTEDTAHGGPQRAVCLFAAEAIERIRADGHPLQMGSAGENLTTAGIEWSTLPVGTIVRVGDQVELELSSSTTPCATQVGNFRDGNFNRMNIDRHPSDSRMYARVLHEGDVAPGDQVTVFPVPPGSRAADELLLKRLERAEGKSSLAAWRAARDAGFEIDIVDIGELAMCAAPTLPGPAFNQATGLGWMPHLLSRATDFYDAHGTIGHIWLADPPPWPADVSLTGDYFGAPPEDIAEMPVPDGVVIRRLDAGEAHVYTSVSSGNSAPGGIDRHGQNPWPSVYANMARHHLRQLFVAEIDGRPVANASLHVTARTGWLRGALTAPEARGRGIQRALIAARVRAAMDAGCDLVGAEAEPGAVSARNLERSGMRRVGQRSLYAYIPAARVQ